MAEYNSGNQYGRGRQRNQRSGQAWRGRRPSGDGNWNVRPPFSPPPSFPPPFNGSSTWMSGPPPQLCVPPPSYQGPPPPFSRRPPFSSPPPPFSGPPPSFGNQAPQHNPAPCWNSPQSSSPSPSPLSGSGAGHPDGKRRVNDVWSDSNLFSDNGRTLEGAQNRHGHPHHYRGQRGGRGAGGRGRGRGHQQFQQDCNNRNNGNNFGNNSYSNNDNNHRNNNNDNRSNGGKKKEKVDKRDLPENNKFHCEVCDRGFRTEEKYQEHVDEHTQCWVDGCRYVAAPKLVQLHYYAQHKTGMAKKIWSLDSPESIKKWIEERKRNYPTKDNVARKEKERAERRARGQVIENKQFSKMRGGGRGRGRGRGHRGHYQRGGGRGFEDRHQEETDARKHEDHDRQNRNGEQTHDSFPGIQEVTREQGCSQEKATMEPEAKRRKLDKDEGEKESTPERGDSEDPLSLLLHRDGGSERSDSSSPVQHSGDGLTSLIASYDDSDREDGELPEDSRPVDDPQISPDDSVREDDRKSNETTDDIVAPEIQTHREEPAWIRLNKCRRDQKYRSNTLLERLLVNEIRHERNVLLQCVHYIVKNNFLGVVEPTTQSAGPTTRTAGPTTWTAGPTTQPAGPTMQPAGPTTQPAGPTMQPAGPTTQTSGQ